jgi:hypothetical protein
MRIVYICERAAPAPSSWKKRDPGCDLASTG